MRAADPARTGWACSAVRLSSKQSEGPRERFAGLRVSGVQPHLPLQTSAEPRSKLLEHSTTRMVEIVYGRSEEHTSELQSRLHLVCRLLLEKKKKKTKHHMLTSM